MIINGNEYFYDIERQKYVMLLKNSQRVKNVEKEHIYKAYLAEVGRERYLKDKKEILDKIELRYLAFEPHKPQKWIEDNFQYKNTFLPSPILKKSQQIRKNLNLDEMNKDLSFLKKYPNIDILLNNLFVTEKRKHYFINWLSTAFNTLKKNGTAIVLRGIPGTGKNVLYENIIEYAIGKNYCVTIGNDDLKSNFNATLENRLFVLANEIKGDFRDGNASYEKLKQYITDTEMRVEQKGIDSRKIINYFNMLVFSNNQTPLQIQGGDRRYTIYETSTKTLKSIAENELNTTIESLINAIRRERDDFISDVFKFDYDKNLARTCHETNEKERIYRASMTKIEILADKIKRKDLSFFDFIEEILESEEEKDILEFFDKNKIFIIDNDLMKTYDFIKHQIVEDFKQNRINNSYLIFLYFLFVSKTDSITKRGTNLTSYFGKSVNIKKDGAQKRYRMLNVHEYLKLQKQKNEPKIIDGKLILNGKELF